MYYKYEKNNCYSFEYMKKIDQIEDLRGELKISDKQFSSFLFNDIYDTNKIEGNSMNRNEVAYLLENDVTIREKSLRDHIQIHNSRYFLDTLDKQILDGQIGLSEDLIFNIHHTVTVNELPDTESGVYRSGPVHIRFTDYIPPIETDVPSFMRELIEQYKAPPDAGETKFERICEFKRNFERIHPFIDGNGRTGRLLMNLLLLQNGYGYFSAPYAERDLYFKSLNDNTFADYAAEKVINSMLLIKERDYNLSNNLNREGDQEGDYNDDER